MHRLVFLLLLLIASCGYHSPQTASTKAIIGDPIPNWQVLESNSHLQTDSIYFIENANEQVANGLILHSDSKYLITNAHVALKWKIECRRTGCPKIIAKNEHSEAKVINFSSMIIDLKLDTAFVEFIWNKKKKSLAPLSITKEAINHEDKIYLIGYSYSEQQFVYSEGKILGDNLRETRKPSIHYDADTEPGMSGSPVFNEKGELIALHFGYKNGLNRAIPFSLIKQKYPNNFH